MANVDEIAPIKAKSSVLSAKESNSFTNLLNQSDAADDANVGDGLTDANDDNEQEERPTKHVPIDWSLKTKLRLLSKNPIPGARLKCNEEASGITG